jgi:tripartite-type tricarboxylate transporter receptor subunit TctC
MTWDVPTIAGLPSFVSEQRYGLLAPAGTPRPIIERLNVGLRNALARKRIVDNGATHGRIRPRIMPPPSSRIARSGAASCGSSG